MQFRSRRKAYASRSRAARMGKYAKSRTTSQAKPPLLTKYNKPVMSKLRRPRRSTFTKTGRNKNAIVTLSRQVKSLQNRIYGEVQSNTQHINGSGAHGQALYLSNEEPFLILMNDMYDSHMYKGVISGTTATYGVAGTFTKSQYQSDLDDSYEWNARRNQDTVSDDVYKPIYSKVSVVLTWNFAGVFHNGRLRMTLLKVKPHIANVKVNVDLPGTLGAYRRLADPQGTTYRNYFDPRYHEIISDKWYTIKTDNKLSSDTDQFRTYHTMSMKFPHQVLRPDINRANNETLWTNIPTNQQYWLLISLDGSLNGKIMYVAISKFNVWRDQDEPRGHHEP